MMINLNKSIMNLDLINGNTNKSSSMDGNNEIGKVRSLT